MIVIAHRGNVSGPEDGNENKEKYLKSAINQGFMIEVDLWAGLDLVPSLGHERQSAVRTTSEFLNSIAAMTFFHCKNLQAVYYLSTYIHNPRWFIHHADESVAISNSEPSNIKIWRHSSVGPATDAVWAMPESKVGSCHRDLVKAFRETDKVAGAVCTDYARLAARYQEM